MLKRLAGALPLCRYRLEEKLTRIEYDARVARLGGQFGLAYRQVMLLERVYFDDHWNTAAA
jgi:hypothetical protein